MQRSRIRQRIKMPSLLAHCITDSIDVDCVASECDDRYERVTEDVEVGGEDGVLVQGRLESAGGTDDDFAGLRVS
jgi:hypothetical protein